ncbi:MAG: methyltransferase domain-containing protein, partial [Acidobacteria bacterium]|nr:methyltransferase domain-containing protein [Acidobacteriota bacterium]
MNERVRDYWNTHIHDLEISTQAPGTPGFFADLDQYHFEKLHHLLKLIRFDEWKDKDVLDVGCGAGVEVVRFARAGARTTGVDIAQSAITLARQNLEQQGLEARLEVADGEHLPFPDAS